MVVLEWLDFINLARVVSFYRLSICPGKPLLFLNFQEVGKLKGIY